MIGIVRAVALSRPTPDLVRQYIRKFESDESLVHSETAVEIVFRQYPLNSSLDEILIKIAILNQMYSTNIRWTFAVAKHIQASRIDQSLRAADPNLVDMVARARIGDGYRRFYSFATKYCSFHAPESFPIWDQYVDRLLIAYSREFSFAVIKSNALRDYATFKEVLRLFSKHFSLDGFSAKELDQFLWLYGKELFAKPATK